MSRNRCRSGRTISACLLVRSLSVSSRADIRCLIHSSSKGDAFQRSAAVMCRVVFFCSPRTRPHTFFAIGSRTVAPCAPTSPRLRKQPAGSSLENQSVIWLAGTFLSLEAIWLRICNTFHYGAAWGKKKIISTYAHMPYFFFFFALIRECCYVGSFLLRWRR